jgi:DNA-binding transcriptional regulator LsrR (DeoR family)
VLSERPSETILTARVARMYYIEDRSKSDIANEVGMSRFRVARLLDTARRVGVVNIEIRPVGSLDAELSLQLQSSWGLKHAVVLDVADEDHAQLRRQLGESAAHLLLEIVTPEDVLGIAWSRSASAVGEALQRFVPCQVVQLSGAISRPDGGDVLGLVRKIARLGGGSPNVFYAPMVVPDAATARVLRKQPEVVRAMSLVPKVSVAVVGVGAWSPGLSTIHDSVEQDDRDLTARLGVVAEISGVFVDQLGAAVRPPLSRRIVGISADELSKIDNVLAIAYDEAKADATVAALRSGLVNGLITHSGLARKLVEQSPVHPPGSAATGRG